MSAVVGIDLSSRAIDFAKIDETTQLTLWTRVELPGTDAWQRTLAIHTNMPPGWYWDDVYLVAIEAPYGRGQPGTQAILNRVAGAIAASLPAKLRAPGRCWIVRPDEWKRGLQLKGKPTRSELEALVDFDGDLDDQNARDAACIARWARDENGGVAAA